LEEWYKEYLEELLTQLIQSLDPFILSSKVAHGEKIHENKQQKALERVFTME